VRGHIVLPDDANFINVKDYGAVGDGQQDDTDAIRRAIQENINQHKTLFFPKGTYLISDSLDWRGADGEFYAFLTFQGEGTEQTIIRLQPAAAGFGDREQPKAMTRSGSIQSGPDGIGNRAHNNYIFDMTFEVGRNNPGAIAIDFTASNTGGIENVLIRSEDGQGAVGLNLTREVGPCLIKQVEIQGFDVGIRTASALYSITLEQIHLENQRVAGIQNQDNLLAIHQLTSHNSVPAIVNGGDWTGQIVLVDAALRGGASQAVAISNRGSLLLRNVEVEGYGAALDQDNLPGDTQIEEYVTPEGISLDNHPVQTLNLPILNTPEFSEPDLDNWVNVEDFGAIPDDDRDDAEAIQRAIDAGEPVLYFPTGTYRVDSPVLVRGNVQRIIGFQSVFATSDTRFRFVNEDYPVIFERFNFFNGGTLENQASKPVIVRHATSFKLETKAEQATWFLEDTATAPISIQPGQTLYARQLNCELPPPEPMLTNEGGTVWLLGYKTEFGNTVAATLAGGKTEILGGLFYPAQGISDPSTPILLNAQSEVSATYREIAFGPTYTVHIQEFHGEGRDELLRSSLGEGAMVFVSLYSGKLESEPTQESGLYLHTVCNSFNAVLRYMRYVTLSGFYNLFQKMTNS
jgi:hypothetical protein